jgi:hypothetical protein
MELFKKQGNIFDLTSTDYSLVFGHNGMAMNKATQGIGIHFDPFVLPQPIEYPNNPLSLIRFVGLGNCEDENLRTIVHNWLKEANQKGKIHLATNGVNNSLQPEHNINPEFEMRQFERARLIESLILSWCKFNQNNFETITLISMDPDFLEI